MKSACGKEAGEFPRSVTLKAVNGRFVRNAAKAKPFVAAKLHSEPRVNLLLSFKLILTLGAPFQTLSGIKPAFANEAALRFCSMPSFRNS